MGFLQRYLDRVLEILPATAARLPTIPSTAHTAKDCTEEVTAEQILQVAVFNMSRSGARLSSRVPLAPVKTARITALALPLLPT